jgi:hypothetical protein
MNRTIVFGLFGVLLAGCAVPAAGEPGPDGPLLDAREAEGLIPPCNVCEGTFCPKTGQLYYDIPAPVVIASPVMTLGVGGTACTFSAGTSATMTLDAPCDQLDTSATTGTLEFTSTAGDMYVTIKVVSSDASPVLTPPEPLLE